MERTKPSILCCLFIILLSTHIPSRQALENTRIERPKSLALVQESGGLETATLDNNGESMRNDTASLAKGQRGGRGSGGGNINHAPRKSEASSEACHHMLMIFIVGVTSFRLVFIF